MTKKIAINGFGRIGRLTFRNLLMKEGLEVVAINDLTDNKTLAHLLKYDSAHGQFPGTVDFSDDSLIINGKEIKSLTERDPAKLPWKDLEVDVVLECTGIFRTKEKAEMHLKAGAKDVIMSAPAKGGEVQTIVLGVNEELLDRRKNVFSNASCTTNCFAPVVKILNENWGIVNGSMTTTHSYTADQRLQDAPHRDLRRARAAAFNIIPTSTGAAKATGIVIPEVAGKIFASAMRVPVITGSLVEFICNLEKEATAEEINAKFKEAADGPMKGILQYTEDPIVSSDIIGNKHSSIFDAEMTKTDGKLIKIVSWYDNEAGYSARLADFAELFLLKKRTMYKKNTHWSLQSVESTP